MNKKIIVSLGDEYTDYLCNTDSKLCKLITAIGNYQLNLQENYYEALVKRIIGQQLSLKAANTIISRVNKLCTVITPEIINATNDGELSNCGVSKQKTIYIRDLTEKILSGKIDLNQLSYENDELVIKLLTQIKGIGTWTAEMFLIFSLGRLNILSTRDVSIKNALKWLYQLENEEINWKMYRELWSPYNTVVSLYLWEIINRNYIKDFKDISELYESIMYLSTQNSPT